MKGLLVALAVGLVLAVPSAAQTAMAQTTPGSTIEIAHPFARATAVTAKTGAAYFTIVNTGTSDDRLIAASSPIAEKAELHSTIDDKGVMRMRPLAAIEVKAGGRVELKPGGMHLMLTGLKAPLKVGQSFPLTLTFEKAGAVAVTVSVEKAGAMGGHDMPGMKM
jgi:copper(I)-binding protein